MPNNPMLFGQGHPIVELEYWTCFSDNLHPYFRRAVRRDQAELPYWFAPLAWGVIVASPVLLLRTACKESVLGWTRLSDNVYHRAIGKTRLRVRQTNDGQFWLISRWPPGTSMHSDRSSETLVHGFGSIPLVTETLIEALHLAYWFQTNDPIGGLRWRKATPDFWCLCGAIAFANRRARSEGLTISWNDLWASSAHSRRMKRGGARYRNGKLLPPVFVRLALGIAFAP